MSAEAARYLPGSGIFGPTTGLDPVLFDGRHELRPAVRHDIMDRLDRALRVDGGLTGSEWQDELKVYLAGGSASEWAGGRPNDAATDLDILIGVDYDVFRGSQSVSERPMDDREIDAALNATLRKRFNDPDWHPDCGGHFDLTGYVNPDAYDIRKIKPYAAWDLSDSRWAVRPPHLPAHSAADFDPAILSQARAVATEARAILRQAEPARTRQARALWERLHAERRRAFSDEGDGWEDPGNLIEKWLAYAPGNLLQKIRDLALTPHAAGYNESRPPAGRVASGSDGDRMVTCSKGHEHWGAHGAAGLLMRHKGSDGQIRYLLQKRGPDVDHPNTWSIPSGAKGKGETPEQGALREFREEMGALPRGTSHRSTTVSTDCGDWQFHTVSYDSPELFTPRGRGETDHEIAGAGWFAPREVKHLDLHPAFAKSWDTVRKSASARRDHSSAGGVSLDVRAQESTKLEPREGVAGYDVAPRSGMIYLPVPEGLIERVPGGVDDEQHITVVYLGKDLSDQAFGDALEAAARAAAASRPLHGVLHGTDTFPPGRASDGKTPAFVPAYVPGIGQLRRDTEHLNASEHKDFRPHVTLAYLEDGDPVPPPHPARQVSFTHLHVKRGGQVVRFPLGG